MSTVSEEKLQDFVANEKKPKPSKVNNAIAFVSLLVCLNSMMNNKPLLQVNIDTMLPHITLPIGPKKSNPNIALTLCYDSAAVLCVGYADFHLSIVKQYLHVVKSLVWADDKFTPLSLTGIVGDEGKDTGSVTSLKAVI